MGTDIHFYVEAKAQDKWEHLEDPRGPMPDGYEEWSKWRKEIPDYLYDGRNYDLFAILADVRNGSGFAGIDTGDGFNPIAMPRGLPEDMSEGLREIADEYCHSHTYLGLQEILDYDWDQTTAHRGVVNWREYMEYKEKGKPPSWCGDVSGGGVRNVSNQEMGRIISEGVEDMRLIYTRVQWTETYRDSCSYFLNTTLPALQKLAEKYGGPENLRIVFWFDS